MTLFRSLFRPRRGEVNSPLPIHRRRDREFTSTCSYAVICYVWQVPNGKRDYFKKLENFSCIWFLRGVGLLIVGTKVKLVLRGPREIVRGWVRNFSSYR